MSEEKKQAILDDLKTALAEVPEQFHEDVSKALTHDISVISRTIGMVQKQDKPSTNEGL